MPQEYFLTGARLIDPLLERDEIGDLAIRDGKIVAPETLSANAIHLDLRGKVVAPGFLDLHVHLREPGQTHKEDIHSHRAAAAGVHAVLYADTAPPIGHGSLPGT